MIVVIVYLGVSKLCEEPDSKYLGLYSHKVAVATTQLYCCSTKAAINNTQ
jgi:hypothetical protein